MHGINGIWATRLVLHTSPEMGIIMVIMLEDNAPIFVSMRIGQGWAGSHDHACG